MGEDKRDRQDPKGGGGHPVLKLFAAMILVAGLIVGGSVLAAKFTDHPEWNLVNRILELVNAQMPQK